MEKSTAILKIKHGDKLCRIAVKRESFGKEIHKLDMTFGKLEETVHRAFKIPETSEISLVYTDTERDEVIMANDDDIHDAIVYQNLNPVRITVMAEEPHRPAHDDRSLQSLAGDYPCAELASDRPEWAADMLLKLDQLLQALNEEAVEPAVGSVITDHRSTMTEHHVLEEVEEDASLEVGLLITKPTTTTHHVLEVEEEEEREDASPARGSTMEWTHIGDSEHDPELLKRVMILRRRDMI